jgi:hypothetical protein
MSRKLSSFEPASRLQKPCCGKKIIGRTVTSRTPTFPPPARCPGHAQTANVMNNNDGGHGRRWPCGLGLHQVLHYSLRGHPNCARDSFVDDGTLRICQPRWLAQKIAAIPRRDIRSTIVIVALSFAAPASRIVCRGNGRMHTESGLTISARRDGPCEITR